MHLNWAICFITKEIWKQEMIVFHLHSFIYYQKAKNDVVKLNVLNSLIDHYLLDASLTSADVSNECVRCVEAKKKEFFWDTFSELSDTCRTSFGHCDTPNSRGIIPEVSVFHSNANRVTNLSWFPNLI